MQCPRCGVRIVEAEGGGHGGEDLLAPLGQGVAGGDQQKDGSISVPEQELAAQLRCKHQQLARFGLVEGAEPPDETTNGKVD